MTFQYISQQLFIKLFQKYYLSLQDLKNAVEVYFNPSKNGQAKFHTNALPSELFGHCLANIIHFYLSDMIINCGVSFRTPIYYCSIYIKNRVIERKLLYMM